MRRLSGGGKLPPPAGIYEVLRGFVGGTLGIFAVASLGIWSGTPWIIAPFGATCVLLFALSGSPLAQPRSVVLGHLVSALSGLIFINLFGDSTMIMALSVGCAIAAMQVLRVTHAPAGANPLVIFMSGVYNWDFLIAPVLIGAVTLVVVALILNNLRSGDKYPAYWIGSCPTKSAVMEQQKVQGG
jgi:CBS-domain-containing membrane protein